MFSDFSLNQLSTSHNASHEVIQATQYFLNLCFSDGCDVFKNTKFPGTQVVALERKDLPKLHGKPAQHIPYKATEILSWFAPQQLTIPPLKYPNRWFSTPTTTICAIHMLDFGFGPDDVFFILDDRPLKNIDFGTDQFCV